MSPCLLPILVAGCAETVVPERAVCVSGRGPRVPARPPVEGDTLALVPTDLVAVARGNVHQVAVAPVCHGRARGD